MKKIEPSTILIALVATVIMFTNIILVINKVLLPNSKKEQKETTNGIEEVIDYGEKQEIEEKIQIEKLKNMSAGDRTREYLSIYLSCLQKKQYDKAYELLYPDFKENYFKTLDSFSDYIKKTYPNMIDINHDDIQRQGKYYILYVTIFSETMDEENIKQKFIILENEVGEFELSFEVI